MKSRIEIVNTLPYFTGSAQYYKHRFLNITLHLTEGTEFIRESCGAYWLFDIIAQQTAKRGEFVIQFRKLNSGSWIFKTTDFNNRFEYYRQIIPYSDFPLDRIKLFYMNGVCYLPTEH